MRRLTLRKETLSALTDDQLGAVVAGANTQICALTNPCITPAPYTGLKCLLTEGCA
jgi:hypothetical protein